MKKPFLLLIAALGVWNAGAQMVINSNVNTFTRSMSNADLTSKRPIVNKAPAGAGKTTAVGGSEWFYYNVACKDAGTGTTGALIGTYPDSNIYFPGGTPSPFYIWSHGLGVSFDPVSPYFSFAWSNSFVAAPSFIVNNGASYRIDSINVAGLYQRIVTTASAPDTLFIDVTLADTIGAWNVTYASSNLAALGIIPAPVNPWDTTWTIANAYYMWTINAIADSTVPVYRFTKILDAAAAIDTTASGLNQWTFPATGVPAVTVTGTGTWPMYVPAGRKIVAYAHFGSANAFPLGTVDTACNMWRHYSQDFGTASLSPYTVFGDQNGGLISSTDDRYHTVVGTTKKYAYMNLTGGATAPILSPTYFYTTPIQVHNPWFGFYVNCSSGCIPGEVANTSQVSEVKAMPNPSGNMLTITYTLSKQTTGKVTLINMLGQVVATEKATDGKAEINTSDLPGGVYIYSLEVNGQRTSGRVVIVH